MNIALCTDENFTVPALVCITSIFENNKDEDCHIYVLTDGLSDKAKGKFSKLRKTYNRQIDILTIDKGVFDGLTVNERFPVSMYYRFLLPQMLPNVDKILYLDCDIIVRHSLKSMYDTDLTDLAVAAVVCESCDEVFWTNFLRLETPYFNSGVLLINLDYWRVNNVTKGLINWCNDNPKLCNLPDQNALNVVLKNKTIYLDYKYNYQEWWFGDLTNYMHYRRWDDIHKAGKNPVVVHFCEAEKPWFVECKNPFKSEFLHYAYMHDFIGFRLLKRYGAEFYLATIIDKIGLKFRWWAEKWKKRIIKNIRVS